MHAFAAQVIVLNHGVLYLDICTSSKWILAIPSVRPTDGQKRQAELGEVHFDPYHHFRRSSQYGLSDKGQRKEGA
jgi:hypothetical protein